MVSRIAGGHFSPLMAGPSQSMAGPYRGGGLLRCEPGAIIAGEDVVAAQQFGETARFDDTPVAHHGDPLAAPHGRQAMGDDEGRATP